MRRESRGTVRRTFPLLLVALCSGVAAVAVLGFVHSSREVGPGRVGISAAWDRGGGTSLAFPPLGRVEAQTHDAPLAVTARVEELDVERLQDLLASGGSQTAIRTDLEDDLVPLVRAFTLRAIVVAIATGVIVGALLPRRRWTYLVVGGIAGGLAVATLLALTWRGFDPEGFDEPSYEGTLERAPDVIAAVQRHVEDYETLRDRVETLGARLSRLYSLASSDPDGLDRDGVRILHVSDIHSNPLGLEIVADLAERFEVDAVLDTGDVTSFGAPIEAQVGRLVEEVTAPYFYVPGNHDSAANRAALDQVANVELVDGRVVDIGGVRVLGVADPTFTATNEIDSDEAATRRLEQAPEVASLVELHRPDVLAVHDRRLADQSIGRVPLVLAGHTHEFHLDRREGTIVLTGGSTGATGLGSFTVEDDLAYEAELLHFERGRLTVIDRLSFVGLTGSYRIERQVLDTEGDPADAPS